MSKERTSEGKAVRSGAYSSEIGVQLTRISGVKEIDGR